MLNRIKIHLMLPFLGKRTGWLEHTSTLCCMEVIQAWQGCCKALRWFIISSPRAKARTRPLWSSLSLLAIVRQDKAKILFSFMNFSPKFGDEGGDNLARHKMLSTPDTWQAYCMQASNKPTCCLCQHTSVPHEPWTTAPWPSAHL